MLRQHHDLVSTVNRLSTSKISAFGTRYSAVYASAEAVGCQLLIFLVSAGSSAFTGSCWLLTEGSAMRRSHTASVLCR